MNLVIIYGPPAVGKLTVAKELAKQTGYKLLHNHLTVDLITSIFSFDSEQLPRLSSKFRLELLEEAVNAKVEGVILTFVYPPEVDTTFIEKVVNLIESKVGKVCLVRLLADKKELEQRVVNESRKQFNKTTSKEVLNNVFQAFDVFGEIPGKESLTIDNTQLSPNEVVSQIVASFKLGNVA